MHKYISINLHISFFDDHLSLKMLHLRSDEIINEKRWKEIELRNDIMPYLWLLLAFFISSSFFASERLRRRVFWLTLKTVNEWICRVSLNSTTKTNLWVSQIYISIKFLFLKNWLLTLSHYCVSTLFPLKADKSSIDQ